MIVQHISEFHWLLSSFLLNSVGINCVILRLQRCRNKKQNKTRETLVRKSAFRRFAEMAESSVVLKQISVWGIVSELTAAYV